MIDISKTNLKYMGANAKRNSYLYEDAVSVRHVVPSYLRCDFFMPKNIFLFLLYQVNFIRFENGIGRTKYLYRIYLNDLCCFSSFGVMIHVNRLPNFETSQQSLSYMASEVRKCHA